MGWVKIYFEYEIDILDNGYECVKCDSWVTGVSTWVAGGQRQRAVEKDILWGKIKEFFLPLV